MRGSDHLMFYALDYHPLRKAFLKLAVTYHPDKFFGNENKAKEY